MFFFLIIENINKTMLIVLSDLRFDSEPAFHAEAVFRQILNLKKKLFQSYLSRTVDNT